MPWDASPGGGFTAGEPWLPLGDHSEVNVAAESVRSDSMLMLYRRLLALRRTHSALSRGTLADIRSHGDVLIYERRHARMRLIVVLNLGHAACEVSIGAGQILLSTFLDRGAEAVSSSLALRASEGVILVGAEPSR
jgi:alpha-glucosidase